LFSGVADGVIGEVTEYPQLIKLGYDVVAKSEVRQGLWNGIKNITPESVKNVSVDFYEQKKANYTSDKSYLVNHTVGQDGVTVVSIVMGAGFFKKGTDGLKEGIEDTGKKLIKKETDEVVDVLGKIVKNGNKIEYTNPAGKVLKWSEQNAKDIENSIQSALKRSTTDGKYIEGKVADFIKNDGKSIDGFGLSIDRKIGGQAGDVDILTKNEMIEVKKSFAAWSGKKDQIKKFVDTSMEDFLNPYNKKVIIYIDEPLTVTQKAAILDYVPKNVSLVNSLDELKKILK